MAGGAGTISFNVNSSYAQKITNDMVKDISNGFIQKKYINSKVTPTEPSFPTDTSFFYFVDGYYDASTLQRIYSAFYAYNTAITNGGSEAEKAYENLDSILNDFLKATAKIYDKSGKIEGSVGFDSTGGTFYRLVSGIEKYDTGKKDSFGDVIYGYQFIYEDDNENLQKIAKDTGGESSKDFYLIPIEQKENKNSIGYNQSLAYKGLPIQYLALAVTFEKSLIQQDILLDEIAEVDAINNRITLNNNMLNAMNIVAQKYYTLSVSDPDKVGASGPTGDPQHYEIAITASDLGFSNGVTIKSLNKHLLDSTGDKAYQFGGTNCPYVKIDGTVGDESLVFSFAYTDSDNKNAGTSSDTSKFTNIDVTEQGAQTGLSNMQDAIRSYGDKCSTAAQMANTYMQQYMQSMNSTINLGTQMCKNIGDYYKSITNNIR